jgi:hypothetical protein
VPPAQTASSSKEPEKPATNGEEDADNSQPFDFTTFVPTHDAGLAAPLAHMPVFDLGAAGECASKDEAFNHAMGAMYWAGYWTAVYHVRPYSFIPGRLLIGCMQSHNQRETKPQGKRKRRADEDEVEEEGEYEEGFGEAEAEGADPTQSAPTLSNGPSIALNHAGGKDEDFVPTQR